MKNNILLIAILILFGSCSKKILTKTGEFESIEKSFLASNPQGPGRILAQSDAELCLSDELRESRIVEEIRSLENNKATGSKLIINGLDLSKFPASQALYLEKNKEWIYTKNLDLAGCSDIKCVFNKIYPASNGLEGYLSYYFSLKMGYALSTVNSIPEIALGESVTFQDTLFSKEELNSFYLLSKSLSSTFQKLPTLSSLHRMPRNTFVPKYGENTCGLAGGAFNKGYIVLMDSCLTRSSYDLLGGNFFPLVTHEISHRLDYSILKNYAVFSESKTWLDLSGWYLKENINQETGKVTGRQWAIREPGSDLKYDGFVRNYAGTSPAEDFADSIGFARFTPDDMLKVAPRKFNWITKNIFNGKAYTSEGINAQYINFLNDYAINGLPSVINNCVSNPTSYAFLLDAAELSEFKDYDPALVQCIFGGLNQSIGKGIRSLKGNELQACNYFKSNESAIVKNVLSNLREFIKKDLNQNIEIGIQLKALGELIARLGDEIDPREIFIACQKEQVPMDCYNEKLLGSFNAISAEYAAQIPNQVNSYRDTYLQDNRYGEVKGKIVNLFSQIFVGSDLKFKEEAKRKWKACFNAKTSVEEEDVILSPFSGGTQFIHKSLLNCLNKSAEVELMNVLDAIGKKISISISTQSTKKFIYEMYLNSYTSTLQSFVLAEAKNEEALIKRIKEEVDNKIVSTMTSNTGWIGRNPATPDELAKLCLVEAKNISNQELSARMGSGFGLNFYNLFSYSSEEESCRKILSTQSVKSESYNNQVKAVKNVLERLHEIVLETSRAPAMKCKNQLPKNDKWSLKSRNTCLTNYAKWKSIAESSLTSWLMEEKLGYMSSAKGIGSEYLQNNKAALQAEAIESMNRVTPK
ncbi:MAG: hypothetical protein WC635_10510 [Bacteriovorax sp.]|jgi:hypothetical protein